MDGLRDNFRAFLLRLNRLTRNDQVVLSILAVVIGAVTAVGAIGFRELIHFLHRVLFGAGPDSLGATAAGLAWWQVLLVPTLGGLAIGLFVRYVLPGGRPLGVAQVIEATAYHGGRMPFLAGLGAAFTSAASIGVGGSGARFWLAGWQRRSPPRSTRRSPASSSRSKSSSATTRCGPLRPS